MPRDADEAIGPVEKFGPRVESIQFSTFRPGQDRRSGGLPCRTTGDLEHSLIALANPANGLTNFTFNGTKAQLKIIDILGNEVKVLQLEQPGIKKIDLTDMSKGIYFGELVINNKVTTIKKLILK